jgi:long-subunit acyl-CoA synthetase (AMP-forming)
VRAVGVNQRRRGRACTQPGKLLEEVNAALDKHERLRRLVVVKDSWAVENGFLTPTLKIKRNVIEALGGAQFEEWSERSEAVLWQD